MGLVIPDNGYVLYADNNPDWSGGDHQHHYYDFWKTDLGKPVDNMTEVKSGWLTKNLKKALWPTIEPLQQKQLRLIMGA